MTDPFTLRTIPPEDEALRAPVRAFLTEALKGVPSAVRARSWLGFDADFSRRLAAQGWLGLTLPREYGGGGRSPFARFVLVEELLAAGAPVSAHWIADRQSGPLIARYGTEAQKAFYLPRICRAEAFFCIGMSEPNAGSDLASVRTRAERTASGWRLSGRKIWTTNAPHSHFMIALVRTSGAPEDRHRGLSQVIVDLSLPGVHVAPIRDLAGDAHFSEVTFDDVELPEDALIGTEGAGWEQVTAELAFERSGPERIYSSIVLLEEWAHTLREAARAAHAPVGESERRTLGAFVTELATLRAMSVAVTGALADGASPATQAALVKDLGTSFEQSVPTLIGDALGAHPQQAVTRELADTLDYVTKIAPSYSLRGGTREILRGMIARGLGLR
ncbi:MULTISPECIES: acyl-CoA dehydrogenase family protein [Paraburkholderia]|uniref:Acyl-CoA dehydrogenase family protein n=1 Tax=Paraburkholderia unamae TaxID=219649 RepID=A0ACC6RXT0_9BURK